MNSPKVRPMPAPGQALALVLLIHLVGWGVTFNAARLTSEDWGQLIAKSFYLCCGVLIAGIGWLLPRPQHPPKTRDVSTGVLAVVAHVLASCSGLIWMASHDPDLQAGVIPPSALASQVIIAPLAEELLFTGFLFSAFRSRFGFRQSAFVLALLFTVLHFPPSILSFAIRFTYMLVACSMYERFRSVLITSGFHILMNGALLCEVLLVADASSPVFEFGAWIPALLVFGLALSLFCASWLVRTELLGSSRPQPRATTG